MIWGSSLAIPDPSSLSPGSIAQTSIAHTLRRSLTSALPDQGQLYAGSDVHDNDVHHTCSVDYSG
jgi:hypothetical protein